MQSIAGGAELVRNAGSTMEDIVRQVREVNTLIGEIARASDEQAALGGVGGQRRADPGHPDPAERRAGREQSSAASSSLRQQAEGLTQAISVFR